MIRVDPGKFSLKTHPFSNIYGLTILIDICSSKLFRAYIKVFRCAQGQAKET